MKTLFVVLIIALLGSCMSITYKYGELEYKSFAKKATDVSVTFASPDKVVSVSIGSVSNDQVFEQIGDIIESYK